MKLYIRSSINPREHEYMSYLNSHIQAVNKAWNYIRPKIYNDSQFNEYIAEADFNIHHHDESKYDKEEFESYLNYFYPYNKSKDEKEFNYAWLRHQNLNKHHWQYWCLINDDGGKIEPLDIPVEYVIEMVCDWASFQFMYQNKYVIDWYEDNKDNIILSDKSRKLVEKLVYLFEIEKEDSEEG